MKQEQKQRQPTTTTIDFLHVPVLVQRNIAWMDERPQCSCLINSWRAGRDTGERCERFAEQYERGVLAKCWLFGGPCAMLDPHWIFKPGWAKYAEYMAGNPDGIPLDIWPAFQSGDFVVYEVAGTCMAPTYPDGSIVVAEMGADMPEQNAVYVVRFRSEFGLSLQPLGLKRVEEVGDHYLLSGDNPQYEPMFLSRDRVSIVGACRGLIADVGLDRLTPVYIFDECGKIIRSPSLLQPISAEMEREL